ncbi:MAG: tetratricopeptide repeat protein [Nitrospiraceae bacterium]|nr:tetratricopeptide repeat protein [Nitrospiraceae bacterium]
MCFAKLFIYAFVINFLFCFSIFAEQTVPVAEQLKQANKLYTQEQYQQSKAAYSDIYRYFNKGAEGEAALLGIARSDFKLKLYNEAVVRFNRFLSSFPESTNKNEVCYLLAESYFKLSKLEDAKKNFEKVTEPLLKNAVLRLAGISLKRNDNAQAENYLKSLPAEFKAKTPEAIYMEAELLSRAGRHKEAVAATKKIRDADIKDNDILIGKAGVLFAAGMLTDSEAILKGVLEKTSSAIEISNAHRIMLKIYEAQGKIDEAIKISTELSASESSDELKLRIASFYEKKGDVQSMMRYLTYVSDKNVRASEIEKRLRSFDEKKDPKLTEYLSRYGAYLSADSPYLVEVAQRLMDSNKKSEATTLYRKALTGTNKAQAAIVLSSMLLKEGKVSQAKKLIEPFVMDTRYLSKSSVIMAEILEKEGDLKRAIEYLAKVAKLVKENHNVLAKLADVYWKLDNKKTAVQNYIASASAGDPLNSLKAADALYLTGDVQKSGGFYKKAIDGGLKDKELLQWAEYQYGKISNNKEYLKRAVEKGGLLGEAAAVLAQ